MKEQGEASLGTTWAKILEQIKFASANIYSTVNIPADFAGIRLLEETVGIKLPEAFTWYLSTLNGQRNTEKGARDRNREIPLLGFHLFLSITGIIETWTMMNDLFDAGTEPLEWMEEAKIKPFVWRKHWLPFTECEGSLLILDCDPGKCGSYGQVFLWCSGMDFADVVADSFEEFSRELLFRLSAKKYEIGEFGTIDFEDYYI